MQTPDQVTARRLAQELIDKTRQIKDLESEVGLLKLEIYDAAQEGIQCDGGKVFFVDSSTVLQLDRERLKENLIARFELTEQDAASLIDSCKVARERSEYITVYLD